MNGNARSESGQNTLNDKSLGGGELGSESDKLSSVVNDKKGLRPAGLEPTTPGLGNRCTENVKPDNTKTCTTPDEQLTPQLTPESQKQGHTNTLDERLQTSLQTHSKNSPNQGESQGPKLPPDLADIVEAWSALPEHVRQAIVTLVASVTVTAREGDEVV